MTTQRRIQGILTALCGGVLLISGPAGGAEPVLSFDGSDSYVTLGTPDALQIPSNDPFTVEGWMRFDNLSTRDMLYCKNNDRTSPYTYMLGFADEEMSAYDSDWRGEFAVTRETDRWYHLAFRFDGTNMAFYLDGTSLGAAAFSFANDTNHTVKIGGYSSTADIDGMMSEVRVWNHARSARAIQDNMQRRLFGHESGLLGYWPMNEGSGTVVFDGTANASTGTIISAVWVADDDLELLPADAEFRYANPFTIANLETGSADFTNSNEVDVVDFTVPEAFDLYQVTLGDEPSAIDTNKWISTDTLPATMAFPRPPVDTNVTLYTWFTNTADTVTVHRAVSSTIRFTTNAPVAAVRATYERGLIPGYPVVLTPEQIDDGSTGGTTGGQAMPIYAMALHLVSGPDTNATPEEPFVTVSELGTYEVELVLKNTAGNMATSSVCTVQVVSTTGNDFTWEGTEDDRWSNPLNWNKKAVPVADAAVLIEGSDPVRIEASTPTLASFAISNNATLTFTNWNTTLTADTVIVGPRGTLTVAGPFRNEDMSNNVVVICETFTLDADAEIYLDSKGYARSSRYDPRGHGPGGGYTGSGSGGGGGYGGDGGEGGHPTTGIRGPGGPACGEADAPALPGSGGGADSNYGHLGGPGGGAVKLAVSGQARIDGVISANGGNQAASRGGSGSGGSIWLTCGTLTGSNGLIRANAGLAGSAINYQGGGGAGGRIAISVTNKTAQSGLPLPDIRFSTHRSLSPHYADGEFGTLYFPDLDLIDPARYRHSGRLTVPGFEAWSVDNLWIDNAALGLDPVAFSISVGGNFTLSGEDGELYLPADGTLTVESDASIVDGAALYTIDLDEAFVGGDLVITNAAGFYVDSSATPRNGEDYGALVRVAGNIVLGTNSWIYPQSDGVSGTSVLFRAANVFVEAGGGFDADGRGWGSDRGDGAGTGPHWGGGGGYGGPGGDGSIGKGGPVYGAAILPTLPGSGGGRYGTPGGGLIRLDVDGHVSLAGALLARGPDAGGRQGAGSGGAILIFCGSFDSAETAKLDASGGDTNNDNTGGGGGGRIAVWYGDRYTEDLPESRRVISETMPTTFGGTAIADGGVGGYASGDAGTIRFVQVLYPQGTMILLR